MGIKHFKTAEFDAAVAAAPLAMVDFWADWCGPCKMLSPVIESLADQYEGKVLVGKVNVDEEPELARRFGLREGAVRTRLYRCRNRLRAYLEEYLATRALRREKFRQDVADALQELHRQYMAGVADMRKDVQFILKATSLLMAGCLPASAAAAV